MERLSIQQIPIIEGKLANLSDFSQLPESTIFNSTDFLEHFSVENQELLNSIGKNLNFYLNCLKNVDRWQFHSFQEAVDHISGLDNDFLHTFNMLKILREIEEKNLLPSVDFNTTQLITLIHDGGEIVTGDISQHHPQKKELLFLKEIEVKAFGPIVLRQIKGKENQPFRQHLRELYKRYNQKGNNSTDLESHLVKLIDHFEGNSFGVRNIYSKEILNEVYSLGKFPVDPDSIIYKTIEDEVNQVNIVLSNILLPEEKVNFISFYKERFFINYQQYGYAHIAAMFESKLE